MEKPKKRQWDTETNTRYRRSRKGRLTTAFFAQKRRMNVSYSLKEFHDRFLNDKRYIRLHDEWVKSNYKKQLIPSFDRTNRKMGYSFDNITVMTWTENRYKQRMEMTTIYAREVGKYLGDQLIGVYKSVSDAVEKTGVRQGNLSTCLSGRRRTVSGYSWRYMDESNRSRAISENSINCAYCNKVFYPPTKRVKCCSIKCGTRNYWHKLRNFPGVIQKYAE